jgi:hypothetical protein
MNLDTYTKGVKVSGTLLVNANKSVVFANEVLANFPTLRFTSGYRTPQHNAAVHGVASSYHTKALAADFVPTDGNYKDITEKLRAFGASRGWWLLVHDAGSGNHFHFEYYPSKLKKK